MTHVLAGDIGGTNSRFAVFDVKKNGPKLVHQDVLPSHDYKTFEAVFTDFLGKAGKPKLAAASMGIAGPVVDQKVKTTNLPWSIDAKAISKKFKIPQVTLLNDLMAVGLGAIAAHGKQITVLQNGRPKPEGTIAVIAAGTGLGEAVFVWDGHEHIACASEGGHTDFAPRNTVEDELLSMMRSQYGRVSYERVASGSTIGVLYDFFVKEQKIKESKDNAKAIAMAHDRNVAVVELATSGKSVAAMHAVDTWCSIYGSEAGNLALKSLSTAGVYVCGGVAAALAPVLAKGLPKSKTKKHASPFLDAFLDKGRLRPLMESIPLAICTEPRAGLLGAATHAASHV